MKYLMWCLFSLVSVLCGCAHVMSESGLAATDRAISYADIKKNPEALAGKTVLVGGIIAATYSSGDILQLDVAQLELLPNGIPGDSSHSAGRFLVISGELLDPQLFRPGLLITIVGEVKGEQIKSLEGADYRYPLISAKEIRTFRASHSEPGRTTNPYQNEIGDGRFMLRLPSVP